MNTSSVCPASCLQVAIFMLAGPSIVGMNVCKVSMPSAPSNTLDGTAASPENFDCARSLSISTSAKTEQHALRSSAHLIYSCRSTIKAFCLPTSAFVIFTLLKHTEICCSTCSSVGGSFSRMSCGRGWVSRIVFPTNPLSWSSSCSLWRRTISRQITVASPSKVFVAMLRL